MSIYIQISELKAGMVVMHDDVEQRVVSVDNDHKSTSVEFQGGEIVPFPNDALLQLPDADYSVEYDEDVATADDIPEPEGTETTRERPDVDPKERNRYRALRAGVALKPYAEAYDRNEPVGGVVQDLLSDLMHVCDLTDTNWDAVVAVAYSRYLEEVQGE